jgi:hypothetical protein
MCPLLLCYYQLLEVNSLYQDFYILSTFLTISIPFELIEDKRFCDDLGDSKPSFLSPTDDPHLYLQCQYK